MAGTARRQRPHVAPHRRRRRRRDQAPVRVGLARERRVSRADGAGVGAHPDRLTSASHAGPEEVSSRRSRSARPRSPPRLRRRQAFTISARRSSLGIGRDRRSAPAGSTSPLTDRDRAATIHWLRLTPSRSARAASSACSCFGMRRRSRPLWECSPASSWSGFEAMCSTLARSLSGFKGSSRSSRRRMRRSASVSSRETWACEMPSSSAASPCVRSRKKRRRRIRRCRASSERARARDQRPVERQVLEGLFVAAPAVVVERQRRLGGPARRRVVGARVPGHTHGGGAVAEVAAQLALDGAIDVCGEVLIALRVAPIDSADERQRRDLRQVLALTPRRANRRAAPRASGRYSSIRRLRSGSPALLMDATTRCYVART